MTNPPALPSKDAAPRKTMRMADVVAPERSTMQVMTGSRSDDFSEVLLNAVVGTIWCAHPDAPGYVDKCVTAAAVAVHGLKPRNEAEAMLAAQAVGLHNAAMECLRRAMLREQSSEVAAKLRRDAANLSRAMADMLDALDRRRGKAPQVVRVERVVVQDGGQAIVGALAQSGLPEALRGGG